MDLQAALRGQWLLGYQIVTGILVGLLSGFAAWGIIRQKFMGQVRQKYAAIILPFELKLHEIVLISVCAGVGEELLFRGAIQPWLGVWVTSLLFVAIHGYLNPFNWRVSIYGLFMTLVIALLGYFTMIAGIVCAMVAHAVIDVVLIIKLVEKD